MNAADRATIVATGGVRLPLNHMTGEREYLLRFPMKSLVALQEKFEWNSVTEICIRIQRGWDPAAVQAALWAGVLHEKPNAKIEDFDDLVVRKSEQYLIQMSIIAAIQNSDITEEDLRLMAENLELIDRAPDPTMVAQAVAKAVEKLRIDGILSRRSGSQSSETQPFDLASAESPSGGSPAASSTGSSAESATSVTTPVEHQP